MDRTLRTLDTGNAGSTATPLLTVHIICAGFTERYKDEDLFMCVARTTGSCNCS